MNPQTNRLGHALLSSSELRWLLGDINVSKSFEYKIKSSIRRKIQILTELELPLLIKNNFFATDDYDKVDDNIGRDLEWGYNLNHNVALVRQRSRVQIPAKASLFCKNEEELALSSAVSLLQLAVTSVGLGINPFSISNGSSSSCKIRIFFLISLFIFR